MSAGAARVWTYRSLSPEATRAFGERIGRELLPGDLITLEGELGSGKTTLVQGIARGAGVQSRYVSSPTFVLVSTHRGRCPFHHIDLYRLEGSAAVEDLGLVDYFSKEAISVIEWAERAGTFLPEERLSVKITVLSEDQRAFYLTAEGTRPEEVLEQIREGVSRDG